MQVLAKIKFKKMLAIATFVLASKITEKYIVKIKEKTKLYFFGNKTIIHIENPKTLIIY